MSPRGTVILKDPPPGLFSSEEQDSFPILCVSARTCPTMEPKEQASIFARVVAKTLHPFFPSGITPEDHLIEHAPFVTQTGYVRVKFTINCPSVVEKVVDANFQALPILKRCFRTFQHTTLCPFILLYYDFGPFLFAFMVPSL